MNLFGLDIKFAGKNNGKLTVNEADKRYKQVIVCDEVHKSIDEKLGCIPEIKDTVARLDTKVDILLKNGK